MWLKGTILLILAMGQPTKSHKKNRGGPDCLEYPAIRYGQSLGHLVSNLLATLSVDDLLLAYTAKSSKIYYLLTSTWRAWESGS
ncbi:hypothetical protein B0H63DRAFT_490598 [Podospora didyma]|uniref:Secreted protein n=1 Tax=Podospora didyma TaxID=330526 RepID=A0AAE0N1B3_9PEZI|nr:hypothetical protein B0H63DRAFT_490598 [Podospora didyma]